MDLTKVLADHLLWLKDQGGARANLSGAYLPHANLSRADLPHANLSGADLSHANLSGANLSETIGIEQIISETRIIPDGDIIGWKKCQMGVIVKLLIPKEAKRNNSFGRKCRAEYAKVLEVFGAEYGISSFDSSIEYHIGKIVKSDSFDEDFKNECSSGIHFFITRIEAENY